MTALQPPRPGNEVWGPPTTPPGVPNHWTPQFDQQRAPHPTLPLVIGVGALIVLTASLLVSKVVLDLVVDRGWPVVFYVALTGVIGYAPSLVWWWFSTKRWGSGRPVADAGAKPQWIDLAWGPAIWFATILVQIAVGLVVLLLDIPIENNTDGIDGLAADRTYTVAIVITAVVAAPIVEELVFRGLIMRSLLGKMPVVVAILLQGVLFGVAHVDPVRGVGNIGLALVLSGVGIALGGGAYLLRRIGPTMVAHAIFNGLVMVLLLTGVRDRLLEENPDIFEQVAVVDEADVAEPHGGGDPH